MADNNNKSQIFKLKLHFLNTLLCLASSFIIILNSFSQEIKESVSDDNIIWDNYYRSNYLFTEKSELSKRIFQSGKSLSTHEPILVKINDSTYLTEHILFIIPSEKIVHWPDYQSVFGDEESRYGLKKIDEYYIPKLTALFPFDFNMVVIISDSVSPNYVPCYFPRRSKSTGINLHISQYDQVDICKYNIGHALSGEWTSIAELSVLDHEIGHGWGVYIEPNDGCHWPHNSTVACKMANHWPHNFGGNPGDPVQYPVGDPENGFFWKAHSSSAENRIGYSKQQLYLMGLQPRFPDTYFLNDAVFNSDSTISYSTFKKLDQEKIINTYGPRIPDYRNSLKKFRVGIIYIAPNLKDILLCYSNYEKAIRFFTDSTQIETDITSAYYYANVPFLVNTNYAASLNSRLADLDGNTSPKLEVTTKYIKTIPGKSAIIHYNASDSEDGLPAISCLPSEKIIIHDDSIVFNSEDEGTYFYTLKATDNGGKVTFDHFVIDVKTCDNVVINASKSIKQGDSILLGGNYRKFLGIYYDYYRTNRGCDSVVITELTFNQASGTEEIENQKSIIIFPNPFTDKITIIDKNQTEDLIVLYNMAGQKILEIKIQNKETILQSEAIRALEPGPYIINVGNYREKIIKL